MSRPLYERRVDRDNEREIVEAWAKNYPPGYDIVKLPMRYMIDFALVNQATGMIVAVMEVKQRSQWYGTMMLSLQKWMELRRWSQMGVAAYWLVRGPDMTIRSWYVDWRSAPAIGWIERNDRNDPEDSEPAVMVRARDMTLVHAEAANAPA